MTGPKEDTMSRNIEFMTVVVFFLMAGLLAIERTDAYAGCREECYTSCCGDEGICNGEEELSCVSDCLKDCGDDGYPGSLSPAREPYDRSRSDDGYGGDKDDTVIVPKNTHPPVGGTIEPHQKKPDAKQPRKSNPQKP